MSSKQETKKERKKGWKRPDLKKKFDELREEKEKQKQTILQAPAQTKAPLLTDSDLEEIINPDQTLKHIEKGQTFLFPKPTEDIDLKTDLSENDISIGMMSKTMANAFPDVWGAKGVAIDTPFTIYERLSVSLERGGRMEGLELQTQSKAMEKIKSITLQSSPAQAKPEESKEGKKR